MPVVKEEKGSEILCHTWTFQVPTVQGDVALQGKTFHSVVEAKGMELPESDKQGIDVATSEAPHSPQLLACLLTCRECAWNGRNTQLASNKPLPRKALGISSLSGFQ